MADWNKAVQESKLFMSQMFLEKGLIKNSRSQAVQDLENAANKKLQANLEGLSKMGGEELADFKSRAKDFDNVMLDVANHKGDNYNNISPWKDVSVQDKASMYRTAGKRAAMKSGIPNSNADLDLEQYNSAVNAVRRSARVRSVGNAAKSYFMNPINDGRYGTAAARIGTASLGVGGVGAITYSLTSGSAPDYSANYSTPAGSDESLDY